MKKFVRTFNWPLVIVWGGSIAIVVYFWIMVFHYLGPVIGRALLD